MEVNLSENLRYLRTKAGLSQEQLANELGISRNKVVSYETSKVEPKLSLILKMSKFFKIRVSSLLGKQIGDHNYQEQVEYFSMKLTDLLDYRSGHESKGSPSNEQLQQFINKMERMTSVYIGLSSLMKYRKKRGKLDPNTEDMMMIIDEILDINKNFIASIAPQLTDTVPFSQLTTGD